MDASALASAESWLSWIAAAKLIAAFLVAIGVAVEFGSEWVSRPFEAIVKHAREVQVAALEKDAATAKSEIANATARAAEANRIAEEERLARVKLEARLASRRLTPEQVNNLSTALQNLHLEIKAMTITRLGDHEAHEYATSIAVAVNNAGIYPAMTDVGTLSPPQYGLMVTPDLKPAFDSVGITVDALIRRPEGLTPLPEIFVGLKPPAF
jgi:NAD(P)-dependent dehydrogenase (short-subunit alcohol dehydrogenase family)